MAGSENKLETFLVNTYWQHLTLELHIFQN